MGYYGVRLALAAYMGGTLARTGSATSASARFVHAVAARFGVTLSDRAAAQLMPVVGALGALRSTCCSWNTSRARPAATSPYAGWSASTASNGCE
jgi:hypothetical protein